jgi:hypothetical protein
MGIYIIPTRHVLILGKIPSPCHAWFILAISGSGFVGFTLLNFIDNGKPPT